MAQASSATLTLAAAKEGYKFLYSERDVKNTSYRERDFLRWVPKSDEFTGYDPTSAAGGHYTILYDFSKPQGLGITRALSQTADDNAGSFTGPKRVLLPRKKYYGTITIDEEAIAASVDKRGAFFPVKQKNIDDLIEQVSEDLEKSCWLGKNGAIGVVGSITNTVITLATAADAGNFSVGMMLGFNTAADGSGTDHGDSANLVYVVGIDIDAGTITLSADLDTTAGTIVAVAANDYIFRSSGLDVTASGDAGNLINGVANWIPTTAETSGTYLGMDRTVFVQHQQGWRQTDVGSIELTIKALFAKMMKYGAKPDSIWLSHSSWNQLEQELGSRAERMDGTAATFGLPTLTYNSPKGRIPVYAASFMPDNLGYALRRDTWKFLHLRGLPHLKMADGLKSRYLNADDAIEVFCGWWGNLACFEMFHNGVFTITQN